MSRPPLVKIEGSGDLVDFLEDLLARAREGEFVSIAVATLAEEEPAIGCGYAYRDDMPYAWSRILASVAELQRSLLDEGL